MLVIDTKITPPSEEDVLRERSRGNTLVHRPALGYRETGIPLELSGCEAAFVGSPRAVRAAKNALENFNGPVFAAGGGTARSLLAFGIPVAFAGSGEGIEKDFEEFLKKRPCKSFAWISARETAADLKLLAQKFQISVRHFAVYETMPAPIDKKFFGELSHPVAWNFYSGKGVKALVRFVARNDVVHLYGTSAQREFENAKLSP